MRTFADICKKMKSKRSIFLLSFCCLLSLFAVAQEDKKVKVGASSMYSSRNISDNLLQSKDNAILFEALESAKLLDSLKSKGPFTIFAPTDDAFNKLPEGTVNTLLKQENSKTLKIILTYHIIPSYVSTYDILRAIKKGKGKIPLKTMAGKYLIASLDGKKIILTDEIGGKLSIAIGNIKQLNGVIHIVDTVALPKF
jgi:uncharacterized surface protein with fasciclin (FAS1) repeats